MKAPENKVALFVLLFFAEVASFFIVCANTRAVARGSYAWSALTDVLFCAQGFTMYKLMTDDEKARTWLAGVACTLGGTVGSLLSIWVTKRLFGG